MTFKIKATTFVIILVIVTLATGLAWGIKIEKNTADQLIKLQQQYYKAQLKLQRLKLQEAEKVLKIMNQYQCTDLIIYQAIMQTFDPPLIARVIAKESEFDIYAVSPKGCLGLMQLSPDKLVDWTNPQKNIRVGARYLKDQIDRFGDVYLALAAYNAGPERVVKYGGIPKIAETQEYVGWFRRSGVL
jgi:soluble lytic murein transglycosylase-like protein